MSQILIKRKLQILPIQLRAKIFRAEGKLAYYRIGSPFRLQLTCSVAGELRQQVEAG